MTVPNLDKILTAQSLENLLLWILNCSWLQSIFKWHRGSSEATLSHSGFLQHIPVLSIIHDVFSQTVPWTMRSTPVCLLQKEPCGTRESVYELHTLEGLFSSAFGEKNRCPVVCGEAQCLIVWKSVKMAKGSWWMRHTVDELMENFPVKIVCVSVILCINLASSSQTVITSSDKISFSLVSVKNFSEVYFLWWYYTCRTMLLVLHFLETNYSAFIVSS